LRHRKGAGLERSVAPREQFDRGLFTHRILSCGVDDLAGCEVQVADRVSGPHSKRAIRSRSTFELYEICERNTRELRTETRVGIVDVIFQRSRHDGYIIARAALRSMRMLRARSPLLEMTRARHRVTRSRNSARTDCEKPPKHFGAILHPDAERRRLSPPLGRSPRIAPWWSSCHLLPLEQPAECTELGLGRHC